MLLTREGYEVWPEGDRVPAVKSEGSLQDGPFQKEFIENSRTAASLSLRDRTQVVCPRPAREYVQNRT
jgi:hypothetical protein